MKKNTLPIAKNQMKILNRISKSVCKFYGLPLEKLFEESRLKEIIQARQMCMYVAFEVYNVTHTDIGKYFSKNHATSIHAVNKVSFETSTYASKQKDLKAIRFLIYEADIKSVKEPGEHKIFYCNYTVYEMWNKNT